jgi:hypothetical protein
MKKTFIIVTALAAFASPALAATSKHHLAPVQDATPANGPYAGYDSPRNPDVVMFGSRIVGEDPDPAIRAQMEHDPAGSEY